MTRARLDAQKKRVLAASDADGFCAHPPLLLVFSYPNSGSWRLGEYQISLGRLPHYYPEIKPGEGSGWIGRTVRGGNPFSGRASSRAQVLFVCFDLAEGTCKWVRLWQGLLKGCPEIAPVNFAKGGVFFYIFKVEKLN